MKRFFSILLAVVFMTGCMADAEKLTYTQIDQETAKQMMEADDGHVVVDVRRQDEYDAGHIPGAILIPNESIGCDAPEALPNYDQIILVYCRSGNRSKQAAQKLGSMGYSHVYEFGGITTWTGDVVTTAEESAPRPAVLSFSSFDGGGHEYTVEIEDPSILSVTAVRDYGGDRDETETGSPYRAVFTFTGLKPGTTTVTVYGRSPIIENDDSMYTAVVDERLNVRLISERRIAFFDLRRLGDVEHDAYRISLWQDGYHVSVNEGEDQYIDGDAVEELLRVVDEYDLAQWDGFDESGHVERDGEAFWLEIRMTDGTGVSAHGDDAFPARYFEAIGSIQDILDSAEIRAEYAMGVQQEEAMKIQVTDGEHTVVYQLNDSDSAKSLYAMLPIETDVENYGRNEKIFYPAQAVAASNGIEGGGEAGGLALFSPWGNVVMYYDSFGAYPGLYLLGEAVEGVEQVKELSGTISVERVE